MAITIIVNGSDVSAKVHNPTIKVNWKLGARVTGSIQFMDLAEGAWRPTVGHEWICNVGGTPVAGGSIDDFTQNAPGGVYVGTEVLYFDTLLVGYEARLDKRINTVAYGKSFFVSNAISNVLTFDAGSHEFVNGYPVRVRSSGTLPAPLSASTTYYVIATTATTCQLSTTSGGSAVNLTDDGTGDHWLVWMSGAVIRSIAATFGVFEGLIAGTIRDGVAVELKTFVDAKVSSICDYMAELANYVWYVGPTKAVNYVPRNEFSAPFNIDDTSVECLGSAIKVRTTREEYANEIIFRPGDSAYADSFVDLNPDGVKKKFIVGGIIRSLSSITVDAVEQDVGIYGVDTGKAWYYTPGDMWIIQDAGGTAIAGASDLFATYRSWGFTIETALDATEQTARAAIETGTSGIYEFAFNDSGITDETSALASATALVDRYKLVPVEMNYTTRTPGLLPGQLQTIILPLFAINGAFLIDSVSAAQDSDGAFRYTVRALSSTRLGDYLSVFRAFLGGGGASAGGGAASPGGGGGDSTVQIEY